MHGKVHDDRLARANIRSFRQGFRVDPLQFKKRGHQLFFLARRLAVAHGLAGVFHCCKVAFETLELNRIELVTDIDNERGIRSYEKAGFVREGILRAKRVRYGEPLDMLIMSVLRED